MTKGELMRLIYSEEELRNIDTAIPQECWKGRDTYFFVMNYNDNRIGGNLEDMREVAKQRGIVLTQE